MAQAYGRGHYILAQVSDHFDVSYATVSRAVKQAEKWFEHFKCKVIPWFF
jgi:putative transposase